MNPLVKATLVLATLSAGCGAASDVLYVGAALGEAGPVETGGPPDTGPPLDSGAPPPVDVATPMDVIDAGGPFDSVCTPAVDFQNLDPMGGGKVFTDNVKNPADFVQTLARKVCAILYRSPPEVPYIPKITFIVQPITTVPP